LIISTSTVAFTFTRGVNIEMVRLDVDEECEKKRNELVIALDALVAAARGHPATSAPTVIMTSPYYYHDYCCTFSWSLPGLKCAFYGVSPAGADTPASSASLLPPTHHSYLPSTSHLHHNLSTPAPLSLYALPSHSLSHTEPVFPVVLDLYPS